MNQDRASNDGFPYHVDRRNTDSLKWSICQTDSELPMWVADMDFRCAEPIIEALHARVDHGVFGYAVPPAGIENAVMDWLSSRYGWEISPEWIVWVPGLVSALHVCCRAFADQQQKVLTFTPIYPPFMAAPIDSDCGLIKCPLVNECGCYRMDMDVLAECVTEDTGLMLLCSPHNPIGRVWGRDELLQVAQFCLERNITLCSDEIHCDLILEPDLKHCPTATLSAEVAANTITLMSPAKTFNLPGLNCGLAVISDPQLRSTFQKAAYDTIPHVNAMGYAACQAAFTQGRPWLDEVHAYLRTNRDILYDTINTEIDGLSMGPMSATYLAWIDVRGLNIPDPGAFFKQAGLRVIDGSVFGEKGFVRVNFACSREHLLMAIDRIKEAVKGLTQ